MPPRESSLDSLDFDIIRSLHKDARMAASEIAHLTGANERTVRKHIDRLLRLDSMSNDCIPEISLLISWTPVRMAAMTT